MLLPELFKNYLRIQKISNVTVKNYLVDINNFLSWLKQKTGIKYQVADKAIFGLFTQETIEEYKKDQTKQKTPSSTLNRRLSALRKFGQFGQNQGWLTDNPANQINNVNSNQPITERSQNQESLEILKEFEADLKQEKTSPVTIRNYVSDLKHFLDWLSKKSIV